MRLSLLSPAILLGACLIVLPACKKKDSGGGADVDLGGPPPTPPAAVNSDYLFYAHLQAKDIRNSAIFTEIKNAVTKNNGTAEWDMIEQKAASEIGVKPTEIDSATICVTEIPPRGEPKFIAIVNANKAFNKSALLKGGKTLPDSRGFYKAGGDGLIHFPDDKTFVILHPDLVTKYLDGYAKSRSGWPMTSELTRAASGHTLFAVVNMDKLPPEARNDREMKEFAGALAARSVILTADLKGKELGIALRASFTDATSAGTAKDTVQKFLTQGVSLVESVMNGKPTDEIGMFMPAVKEAHRALKAAKVEVSGSDLTIAGSYRADFDIAKMTTDAIVRIRDSAGRVNGQNNLRQLVLALHNYESANGRLVIHATGMNGAALRNLNEKPLLSWRVAMLPYIEQDNLYKQFNHNEPWDSETNKKLIDKMPKLFAPVKAGKAGHTHLQMVIGQNAMMPTGGSLIQMIPDGTSNTFAVVEAAEPVIWTKPDDIMLPAKLAPGELKKKFGGQYPGGFNVAMWDGSARFVRDTINERTLGLLINPRDGMPIPNDW